MAPVLPAALRALLDTADLAPVWATLASHLQRRSLTAVGRVRVELTVDGADRLGQLMGTLVRPGVQRLDVAALDRALRTSSASCGIVPAVAELTGRVLVDKAAQVAAMADQWARVWVALDEVFADAGVSDQPWVPKVVNGLRRSGSLTRAGHQEAARAVEVLGTVLARVDLTGRPRVGAGPELGELATVVTGSAHGLEPHTLAGALALRVLTAATGQGTSRTATAVRQAWEAVGVSADRVSGTVLVWGLRPPSDGPWASMMRSRADLGLVTHLTLAELDVSGDPCDAGTVVWACENPQVLQAAARAGAPQPLVCLSGNPAGAGWALLAMLVRCGAQVRYHGDFDWPGVEIAGRVFAAGASPWRMGAEDYRTALQVAGPLTLELTGAPVPTPWDPELAAAMVAAGVAVHEESGLDVLLPDVGVTTRAGSRFP